MYGATGATLDEVIAWINQYVSVCPTPVTPILITFPFCRFTTEYPGEVIFLWMKYLWTLPQNFLENERPFTEDELLAFFEKLKRINNRCPYQAFGPIPEKQPDDKFDRFLMSKLMEQNGGKGCVLIFMDEPNILFMNASEGIYFGPDYFDRLDVVCTPAQY